MSTATKSPVDVQTSVMGKLLAETEQQPRLPKVGDLVEGKVLSVSKSEVHLDIDGITTGVVRGRELFDESGDSADLEIDNIAQATILELENENGEMELSFRHAGHQKAWNELEDLRSDKKPIEVSIVEANRGGLMVRVGRVEGFLPVSQLTTEHYPRVEGGDKNKILEKLQSYIGQSFKVKVIDVDEADSKLIVSEKAAWEEQHQEKLSQFEVGQTVKGTVTGVVDFGAFVEFATGLEGLVHISEMAWQRVEDPHDLVHVGDEIEVKIIGIEGNKISLSMKQLSNDPWMQAVEKYQVGDTVKGKVTKLNPFGAFVELDEEIHGLAHISELSEKNISHPGEVLKTDEMYSFKILSIEPKSHRLGLSIKAMHLKKDNEASDETPSEPSEKPTSDPAPGETAAEKPEVEADGVSDQKDQSTE